MKILSIGNSFSEDATAYLRKISEAGNCPIDISNLYIGGCSLHMHACNIKIDEKKYRLEYNGIYTDRTVSVNEMLKTDSWDIVTVQQASCDSGVLSSYGENGKYVVDYIRNTAPHSEIYFHETWSYEEGSDHPAFGKYGFSSSGMYSAIKSASEKFCSENGNIPIIPCGEVINELRGKKEFDVLSGGAKSFAPQEALDVAYNWLIQSCGKTIHFWAKTRADQWGAKPCSDSQLEYIEKLKKKCKKLGTSIDLSLIDEDELNKRGAGIVIDRLLAEIRELEKKNPPSKKIWSPNVGWITVH